jgi:hypothetical protein
MSVITPVPSSILFLNASAGSQQIVATYTGYHGTITAAMLDGSFASVSPSSASGPVATFTVNPAGGTSPTSNGGSDAVVITAADGTTINVPINVGGSEPAIATMPGIQTYSGAISYVRALTDCPTYPVDSVIATFLNEALQQVTDDLEPILQTVYIPIQFGISLVTLPYDIGDIVAMAYNTTQPGTVGGIQYELLELGPLEFIDSTQGMPQQYGGPSYGGPTLWFRRISDVSGRITLEFAPEPPPGYLWVQYYSRPILWNASTPSVPTNIDPTLCKLAIYAAAMEVARNRRDEVRVASFEKAYDKLIAKKSEKIGRRKRQRRAVVRDVTTLGSNYTPNWWPQ